MVIALAYATIPVTLLHFARRLRTDPCLRGIPLVCCTAFAMVGDRDRSLDAGFDGYITKPIDLGRFVQQVEAFLLAAPPGTRPSAMPASS